MPCQAKNSGPARPVSTVHWWGGICGRARFRSPTRPTSPSGIPATSPAPTPGRLTTMAGTCSSGGRTPPTSGRACTRSMMSCRLMDTARLGGSRAARPAPACASGAVRFGTVAVQRSCRPHPGERPPGGMHGGEHERHRGQARRPCRLRDSARPPLASPLGRDPRRLAPVSVEVWRRDPGLRDRREGARTGWRRNPRPDGHQEPSPNARHTLMWAARDALALPRRAPVPPSVPQQHEEVATRDPVDGGVSKPAVRQVVKQLGPVASVL